MGMVRQCGQATTPGGGATGKPPGAGRSPGGGAPGTPLGAGEPWTPGESPNAGIPEGEQIGHPEIRLQPGGQAPGINPGAKGSQTWGAPGAPPLVGPTGTCKSDGALRAHPGASLGVEAPRSPPSGGIPPIGVAPGKPPDSPGTPPSAERPPGVVETGALPVSGAPRVRVTRESPGVGARGAHAGMDTPLSTGAPGTPPPPPPGEGTPRGVGARLARAGGL